MNVAGATSATLTVVASASTNGNLYRAVFTNSADSAITSAAKLTVLLPPTIKTQPVDQKAKTGATVTFSVEVVSNSTATIQWQMSTNGGKTFTNIVGQKGLTLSVLVAAAKNGYLFRAVVTNSVGTVNTNAAKLTVG